MAEKIFSKVVNGEVVDTKVMTQDYYDNDFVDTTPGTWYAVQEGQQHWGIGCLYIDGEFRPKKQHSNFIWDADIGAWTAPIPYPTDGESYKWNAQTNEWETPSLN